MAALPTLHDQNVRKVMDRCSPQTISIAIFHFNQKLFRN